MAAKKKDTPASGEVAAPTYTMPTPELVELKSLIPDPANARLHDDRNLSAIQASLSAFGQRTPLVVQRNSKGALIIRKGNGTTEAAKRLGWTHLSAVIIDESDASAVAYAIADNRSAELASWDELVLSQLLDSTRNLEDDGALFNATGFTTGFHDALMESLAQQYDEPDDPFEDEQGEDDVLTARITLTCPLDVADEVRSALLTLNIPGVVIK